MQDPGEERSVSNVHILLHHETERADIAETKLTAMTWEADYLLIELRRVRRYYRRLFRFAAIVGGVGWLFAWALAGWGWIR